MDKRWLNVYTVCLDPLNSPEMPHLADPNMLVASPNSSKADLILPHDILVTFLDEQSWHRINMTVFKPSLL